MLFSFFPKSKQNQKEKSNNNNDNDSNNNNNEYLNIINEKIKEEANNYCIECGEKYPKYISINNSIFLCKDCIFNHLQLSQNVSTIIKNDLKILTLNEIQYIIHGGNQNLLDFVKNEFPELSQFDSQIFYNTKAMDYYRKRLKYLSEGGKEPIKPSKKEAYTLIKKVEETDISDIEMNDNEKCEEIYKDNIEQNSENENSRYYVDNYKSDRNNMNDISNMKKKYPDYSDELKFTKHNLSSTDSFKKKYKFKANNEHKDDNINENNNANFEHYNIINKTSKKIKYKKNYKNFDNEKNNFSNNKSSDTCEISNNNPKNSKQNVFKDKDKIYLKRGIFSPQPQATENNKINNVYSKPKVSINKNNNYRTKSDYSNNEISIILNINEFNIDYQKDIIKENKDKENNKNQHIYTEQINNITINNRNSNLNKGKGDENQNKKENIISLNKYNNENKGNNKSINNNNYENNKNEKNINEKEENNERIDQIVNNQNISFNINNFKHIKTINNYNINIEQQNYKKNKKRLKHNITESDFHKRNYNKNSNCFLSENSLIKNEKKNKSKEKKDIKVDEIKNDNTKKNKKYIAKRLIESQNNTLTIDNENEFFHNHIKKYQAFILNPTIKNEINSRYKYKYVKRNNDSSAHKNYSFYNLSEKYKKREKEMGTHSEIKDLKIKEIKKINDKDKVKNKSMEELNKPPIKESIRKKYKNKKIK